MQGRAVLVPSGTVRFVTGTNRVHAESHQSRRRASDSIHSFPADSVEVATIQISYMPGYCAIRLQLLEEVAKKERCDAYPEGWEGIDENACHFTKK